MLANTWKLGGAMLVAMSLVGCGASSSANKGKGANQKQTQTSKEQTPPKSSKSTEKQSQDSQQDKLQKSSTTSDYQIPVAIGNNTSPTSPSTGTPAPTANTPGTFTYQPITHLNVCLLVDEDRRQNTSYSQCVTITADGQGRMSALNLGRDGDMKSIAVSVQALSVPGANPITSLDMCLNAENLDTQCTGLRALNDSSYEAPTALGDNRGDILSAAIGGTAFYAPNALPMTRINLCVAGEGRYVCTNYATADGQVHTSPFSRGDDRVALRNIGLKFSTLSY